MTLANTYVLQARISALESLVIELLARRPDASGVVAALESALAEQHALQIANGTEAAFADAFRQSQRSLLQDVRNRIHD